SAQAIYENVRQQLEIMNTSYKRKVGLHRRHVIFPSLDLRFLLGTEKELAESDTKYAKWFSDDSMGENNVRIFQLSNEIENFKHGTQTLGMYYARLRSNWEELSHYDNFIEWPASAPSEKVPPPLTASEIYAKIVEKTRLFQFLAGLNPDFEYA
ncbi:hypothetical protein GIB67_015889, partial [Kingdonia uniflora]